MNFTYNRSSHGGAIYVLAMSSIKFERYSTIILDYNKAELNGGAISSANASNVVFMDILKFFCFPI